MAAPKRLAGRAACHGIDGTVAYAAVGATNILLNGVNLQDQWQKSQLMDGNGFIVGKAGSGRERTLSVELFFVALTGTNTLANAKAASKLPDEMFDIITLATTGIPFIDGTWNYEGGSYDGKAGDYHKCTVNLSQVQAADGTFGSLALVAG